MKANDLNPTIKLMLKDVIVPGKEANSAIWELSKSLASTIQRETKRDIADAVAKVKPAERVETDRKLQEFIDNPMSPEDESRHLRAALHVGLANGEINPALLEKLDKIIGVNSGKDTKLELVDFSDAFPDLAESVRICTIPRPE